MWGGGTWCTGGQPGYAKELARREPEKLSICGPVCRAMEEMSYLGRQTDRRHTEDRQTAEYLK